MWSKTLKRIQARVSGSSMKTQATLFDDLLIEVDRNSDKLLLGKAKVPLKPVVNRGVAEIYDEVERVFAQVKTLLPYIEKYELITSIERLQEYMKKVKENGVIAIDTETDGLNPIDDKIAGVSIYTKGESPAYIPFRHEYYDFNMDYEVMTHLLKALMRDKIKILMHNAKFDIRVLYNSFGVKVEAHFDTMIAARLLNENEDSNSLKSLWAKYVLGKTKQFSYSELFEGIKYSIFNPEKVYIYAAIDALMTYELWEFQRDFFDPTNQKCIEQDLVDTSSLFYDIEMKVLHIAADMEERGVNLDMQYVKELKERYQKILYDFEDETIKGLKMHQLVWKANLTSAQLSKLSDPINIASPQQMTAIIYDGLGCVLPPKLLKGGKERSAGKDAIKYLATAYPQYASIWEPYANYQKTKTVFSTFIVAIPERVSPTTGKLHTTWNTIGTDTGRFSSRDPNFQNVPSKNKDIRPMFVPHSGNVFVGSDFGKQDLRVLK